MPQYALARHVFVCAQGEHVVFLDVRKDRYFALEAARTAGLSEIVPGWPVPAPAVMQHAHRSSESAALALYGSPDRSALTAVLALLLDKEILTSAVGAGKSALPVRVEAPRGELAADGLDETPHIGVGMFLRFVYAATRAWLLLKYRSLERVVGRVSARRGHEHAERAEDAARVQNLIAVFSTLRPFFFTAKDECLFETLALCEFLAAYRLFPQWVFGVHARPFAAHCWLQRGGTVLNDTVEHVKRYAPIMVV